jgi:hypothetical protein
VPFVRQVLQTMGKASGVFSQTDERWFLLAWHVAKVDLCVYSCSDFRLYRILPVKKLNSTRISKNTDSGFTANIKKRLKILLNLTPKFISNVTCRPIAPSEMPYPS